MVAESIEPEVTEALRCIENKRSFILTGGAGSGKTYSLVSLINEISKRYPFKQIVCITYTNNAVAEIRSRVDNQNLVISTIHEFMWSMISKYQNEIKEILVELINDSKQKVFRRPSDLECEELITIEYFFGTKIEYGEYYSLRKNGRCVISHDHVLIISEKIFGKYKKICDILKDLAYFLFIDEYQDTNRQIKTILLDHINKSTKENIIGFFGDSMQSIYNTGIGAINNDSLIRINKIQNRRNPETVIDLANKLRTDDLQQTPSTDSTAPNMENGEVIQGSIKFLYTDNFDDLTHFNEMDYFNSWDFTNANETKELWLVHKANARMAGFKEIYDLYNSDLILKLRNQIRKKIEGGELDINNESFEELAKRVDKDIRGRGKLLENIKKNSDYTAAYNWIKNKRWEEVKEFRIEKDSLLSYKFDSLEGKYKGGSQRDKILRYLDSIFDLSELYSNRNYNTFLRKINQTIVSFEDKELFQKIMLDMQDSSLSIEQVIEISKSFNLPRGSLDDYIREERNFYLWERIKNLPFSEYVNSIKYQKENFPFMTQHSVKGSEFDNVVVVLDNGRWPLYDFKKMFRDFESTDSVVERTKKIFYVCCTRAKKNLAVIMQTSDEAILAKAKELFGEKNVQKITIP